MAKGILGKKVGMTQVFSTEGTLIPVTVVEVTPNVVLQKKTIETDGNADGKGRYLPHRRGVARSLDQ